MNIKIDLFVVHLKTETYYQLFLKLKSFQYLHMDVL
jgi:hypothetical protein